MIFLAVMIAVVILAFALPGPISELRRRRQADAVRPPDGSGDWWPEFERQFRAYVREHQREAH